MSERPPLAVGMMSDERVPWMAARGVLRLPGHGSLDARRLPGDVFDVPRQRRMVEAPCIGRSGPVAWRSLHWARCASECGAAFMSTDAGIALGMAQAHAVARSPE